MRLLPWTLGSLLILSTLACGDPEVRAFERSRLAGRQIYLKNCAPCHGVEADGRGDRSADLDPSPRNHGDAAWRATVDEATVYGMIADGVPGTAMPAWNMLPEEELRALTTYVLSVAELGPTVPGETSLE